MAVYNYKCTNVACLKLEEAVSIQKPMSESSRKEECEECKQELSRIFSLGGHQTFGDGYKG